MVSGGKERSRTVSQTDALWPSTGEQCRAVVSQVAVAGDRWWDADQAFPVRRGHGHTYEAGPPGHDVSQNPRAR